MSPKRSSHTRQLKNLHPSRRTAKSKIVAKIDQPPFWKRYDLELILAGLAIIVCVLLVKYFSYFPLKEKTVPSEITDTLASIDSQQEAELSQRYPGGYQLFYASYNNVAGGTRHAFQNDLR